MLPTAFVSQVSSRLDNCTTGLALATDAKHVLSRYGEPLNDEPTAEGRELP